MTQVIKNMVKRAFAMCGVAVLAFAVLVSGFSAANPAYADEEQTIYKYDASAKDVLSNGHMDIFYPFMHNDKLIMGFEANSMLYKPENVTMKVGKSSYSTQDFDNYKNKLPFDASKGYWLLDESGNKQDKELFPGWDTSIARYAVDAENPDGATADIVVQKVIAPKGAKVLIWQSAKNKNKESIAKSFEYQDKDDEKEEGSRFELPGVIHQSQVTHQHTNWVFTEPGTYTLEAYAVIKNKTTKETKTTNTVKYTFIVEASHNHIVPSESVVKERGKAEIPVLDSNTKDDDPSENSDCADGNLCILGIRNTGSHPHYHSYEPGGGLNLYTYREGFKKDIENGTIKKPSYEWCINRADEQEDTFSSCFLGERLKLPAEPAMNGMKVRVILTGEGIFPFDRDRAFGTIVVEDHGADGRPVVQAYGKSKVNLGEKVHLKAKLFSPRVPTVKGVASDPEEPTTSIVKKYRWMIKKDGEKEFKNIPMAEGSTLDLVIDKSMQDAVIRASLVLDDGTLYRNAGYDDFCDWNVNIKRDRKDGEAGDAGDSGDSGAHKNRKNTKNRKQNRKHAKNRKNTKNRKKNKSHESVTDENDENNGDENGDKNDAEDENSQDSNSNSDLEKNRKKNKKKLDNKSDEKSDKKLDENDDNNGSQSQSENKIQSVTPLAAGPLSGGRLVNAGKSGRLGGGFAGLGSFGKSKKSKVIKKSKPLKSGNKKVKNSHEDSNDSSDYNDSELDDEQENSEENSHKTKWVAAAVGTASVSLCAITGAGAFLMKPRIKLL
ncbi:cell surface protein [Bifidobacteriaceae bacterium N170]|uniref:Choice-of-anchor M domain-containing protein n=1 Tax=Gardnerella piotii TaxID=2792977 RepID=A0AAU8NPM2_9BIFI|nr:cell surface protein [Bifidobacteriaceae bacterium N170]